MRITVADHADQAAHAVIYVHLFWGVWLWHVTYLEPDARRAASHDAAGQAQVSLTRKPGPVPGTTTQLQRGGRMQVLQVVPAFDLEYLAASVRQSFVPTHVSATSDLRPSGAWRYTSKRDVLGWYTGRRAPLDSFVGTEMLNCPPEVQASVLLGTQGPAYHRRVLSSFAQNAPEGITHATTYRLIDW